MPRTYEPPAGKTVGACRVCGNIRTLKKDGTLRVHGAAGQKYTNCRGSGQQPKGAGDQRPVWLLDVDGVINANRPGWGAAPTQRQVWSNHIGREFRVRFAPELIRRIRNIHRAGQVEIRWCTTWCGDTAVLEQAFTLPELGTSWTDYCNGYVAKEAKLAAAEDVLAEGRKLIWTDDTEAPDESSDLHRALTADGQALLIRPDERTGLQPEHLDTIEAFINGNKENQ
jgi:hypothetical protein